MSNVIDISSVLLRRRVVPVDEMDHEWEDAYEAGRQTRNLARKMVCDIVEARFYRRRGNAKAMRSLLREAFEARSAFHHMLRLWRSTPGFMAGFRRERRRFSPYDGAA